jgi:hypothetical protein
MGAMAPIGGEKKIEPASVVEKHSVIALDRLNQPGHSNTKGRSIVRQR